MALHKGKYVKNIGQSELNCWKNALLQTTGGSNILDEMINSITEAGGQFFIT